MSEISIDTLKTMLANLDDAKKYQSLRDVMETLPGKREIKKPEKSRKTEKSKKREKQKRGKKDERNNKRYMEIRRA